MLKLIYSEKATKFYKISTLLLSYVVPVKGKVEISQNFVAFSEYMIFTGCEFFRYRKVASSNTSFFRRTCRLFQITKGIFDPYVL